jgi:soluble cytochrome b562
MLETMVKKAMDPLDRAEKLLEAGNVPAAKTLVEKVENIYRKAAEELEKLLGG